MKYNKVISFLVWDKKVESPTAINIVEKYMSEFDSRFGLILRNGIDSHEEYEEIKSYYFSKKLNSGFPCQETL